MSKASAIKLAEAHAAGLAKKREELAKLDDECVRLSQDADAVLAEWLTDNPSGSPAATDAPVRVRRKLDDAVARRDRLASEIRAQGNILESLEDEASVERAETEQREQAATIAAVEGELGKAWAEFVATAEKLQDKWPEIVSLAQTLDGLSAGSTPVTPFPSTLPKAIERALTEPGDQPYADAPRVVARRLSTTGGSAATDTRGFSNTLSQLGDF